MARRPCPSRRWCTCYTISTWSTPCRLYTLYVLFVQRLPGQGLLTSRGQSHHGCSAPSSTRRQSPRTVHLGTTRKLRFLPAYSEKTYIVGSVDKVTSGVTASLVDGSYQEQSVEASECVCNSATLPLEEGHILESIHDLKRLVLAHRVPHNARPLVSDRHGAEREG